MKFLSTNKKAPLSSARTAIMQGLAPDGGLYVPTEIPKLPASVLSPEKSFVEIATEVACQFFGEDLSEDKLEACCKSAFNFPAPLVKLENSGTSVLELFHGPSLAFKDFGARFMSRLMAELLDDEITILVATSGDTGGAVAAGFHNVPGVKVVLLYPKDKVSRLQRLQFTTLGGNIQAIEINGSFDDCQHMVKQAFLDKELKRLAAANSINIARLVPQSIYYIHSSLQLEGNPVFSVPSGNFGNVTAGLYAKEMGAPIEAIIAPTNANDAVPRFISSGNFEPRPSVHTISNAMDVGNPSNFARMIDYFGEEKLREILRSESFDDFQTREEMKRVYQTDNYIMCPHTAVASLGLGKRKGVILATAHPAKFLETVEETLGVKIPLPDALEAIKDLKGEHLSLSPEYSQLKDYLVQKS